MSLTNTDSICDARREIKKIRKTSSSASVETVEEETSFDDGYTLSAYGDISHSEIYFVPSVPSETCPSPTRQSSSYRRNAKKPPPPGLRKNNLLRMPRSKSPEEQSVAQLAQKAAMSQPELDFNTLVATLRQTRSNIAKDRPAMPYLKSIEGRASSPRSTRKSIEDKDEEIQAEKVVVKKPGTAQTIPVTSPLKPVNSPTRPHKKANAPSPPKPPASPKPWRANGLPRRAPLPRWDLMDPDVILEGKNYRLKSCLST